MTAHNPLWRGDVHFCNGGLHLVWVLRDDNTFNAYSDAIGKETASYGVSDIIGFHLPTEPFGFLSNWYEAEFDSVDLHFTSSEQYMMYEKVCLAKEYDLADKIMHTKDPAKAKEYAGSKYFKTYDSISTVWEKNSRNIVKRGVRAKFSQNPDLLRELLNTGSALLAECAGKDTTWGIGINLHDGSWHNVQNWRGKNQLGVLLMELREEFRYELAVWGAVQTANYRHSDPIEVWNMTAGQLRRNPAYYSAIHCYADQLPIKSMDDKRMAGAYEIILAVPVGTTEIVLGHCPDNEQFPYMVGHCTQNPLFTSYHCCTYGDSYLEVLKTFADETAKAVHSLEQELAAEKMVSDNQHPFNTKRCLETDGCHLAIPSDEFFQKVIVIKPEVLKPEFQLPTRQLYVCTGGFGAYPKSRGSACFCTSLYSGKHTRFEREDILATMDIKAVPQWAQENLRKALSEEKKLNQKKEAAR